MKTSDGIILFKLRNNRCPFCNYFLDVMERHIRWDAHCHPCNIFFQTTPHRDKDGLIDVIEFEKGSEWYEAKIPNDFIDGKPTPEQLALEEELDKNRMPAIIPDMNFHDWFVEKKEQAKRV